MTIVFFLFSVLIFSGFLLLSRITMDARKQMSIYQEIGNSFRLSSIEHCERADKLESQFDKTCKENTRLQAQLAEYEGLLNRQQTQASQERHRLKDDHHTEIQRYKNAVTELQDQLTNIDVSDYLEKIAHSKERILEVKREIAKLEREHKKSNYGNASFGMSI